MFVLKAEIKIGQYVFKHIHSVKIEKSVTELCHKAVIKLPISMVVGEEQTRIEEVIKHGDSVHIRVWYDGYESHDETFEGYVRQVHHDSPLVIECESKIGLLRKRNLNKRWFKQSLNTVLNDVLNGEVPLDSGIDLTLSTFTAKQASAYQILLKIKENYGLDMYINRSGQLYCGLRQVVSNSDKIVYKLHQNVISSKLKWQSKEDIRLSIKAIAILPDDRKIEVQVGDSKGEVRTLHFYNIDSVSKLKELALSEMELYKFSGYRGYLLSFLIPKAQLGDTAVLMDDDYPSREGSYFIKGVITTFGVDGARRKIVLGQKL